jgi:hypothetical protein
MMEHSGIAATKEMFLRNIYKILIKFGFEYQWGLKVKYKKVKLTL